MRFKKGDWIWTPQYFTNIGWVSSLCKISYISEDSYWIEINRQTRFDGIEKVNVRAYENEVFDNKEDCDKYIQFYYYNDSCNTCKYKDTFTTWKCGDCHHIIEINEDLPLWDNRHEQYICGLMKNKHNVEIAVGNKFCGSASSDICKYYKPILLQNIREYISWEHNKDILKNCEFNPECKFHKESCYKTCTYDWYMNQKINIPITFKYKNKIVKAVQIHRHQWINQNYIKDNKIICLCLYFEYETNRQGRPRKEDLPTYKVFDELTEIEIKEE